MIRKFQYIATISLDTTVFENHPDFNGLMDDLGIPKEEDRILAFARDGLTKALNDTIIENLGDSGESTSKTTFAGELK